jgi:hypothetical protein
MLFKEKIFFHSSFILVDLKISSIILHMVVSGSQNDAFASENISEKRLQMVPLWHLHKYHDLKACFVFNFKCVST